MDLDVGKLTVLEETLTPVCTYQQMHVVHYTITLVDISAVIELG